MRIPAETWTSPRERREDKPRQVRRMAGAAGTEGVENKPTVSALAQPMLLCLSHSRLLFSVASRCSGPPGKCKRVQTAGSMPAVFGTVHLPGCETLTQVKAAPLSQFVGVLSSWPSRCPAREEGLSVCRRRATFQVCFLPSQTVRR